MKKRKIISGFIVLTLFWCILSFFTLNSKDVTTSKIRVVKESDQAVQIGEISKGKYINQDFICPYSDFYGFSLEFSNYKRDNNEGTVFVILRDLESNKKILNNSVSVSDINDKNYMSFYFNKQSQSKGRKYRIEITSNSPANKSVSLYVTRLSGIKDFALNTNISHLNDEDKQEYSSARREVQSKGDSLSTKKYSHSYILNNSFFFQNKETNNSLKYIRIVFIVISYLIFSLLCFVNKKMLSRGQIDNGIV